MRQRILVGLATMAAALVLAGRAEAQGLSIGLGAGTVDPQDSRTALWLTANLRWKLAKNVVIEPEVGYWKKSETTADLDSSLKDMSAGANVLYRVPRKRLTYFVGGGLGVHVVKSSVRIADFDSESDTEIKQGLHFLAGLDIKLAGALSVFGAARFDAVADVDQSKLYGGLRFKP